MSDTPPTPQPDQHGYTGAPDEPIESEGIGPLGIIFGGVTEGVEGVVSSVIGEGLIDAFEHHDVPESAPNIDIPTDEEVQMPDQHVEYEQAPPE